MSAGLSIVFGLVIGLALLSAVFWMTPARAKVGLSKKGHPRGYPEYDRPIGIAANASDPIYEGIPNSSADHH